MVRAAARCRQRAMLPRASGAGNRRWYKDRGGVWRAGFADHAGTETCRTVEANQARPCWFASLRLGQNSTPYGDEPRRLDRRAMATARPRAVAAPNRARLDTLAETFESSAAFREVDGVRDPGVVSARDTWRGLTLNAHPREVHARFPDRGCGNASVHSVHSRWASPGILDALASCQHVAAGILAAGLDLRRGHRGHGLRRAPSRAHGTTRAARRGRASAEARCALSDQAHRCYH